MARNVAFVFPGMGSEHCGMAQGLYAQIPAFRKSVDHCCDILSQQSLLGFDLRLHLFGRPAVDSAQEAFMRQAAVSLPSLFVVEYSLMQLFLDAGVQPVALAGHSVGEYVAAVGSGLLTLEDGLELIATLAKATDSLADPFSQEGAMLSCRGLEQSEVSNIAMGNRPGIHLAAANSPKHCVVSGTVPAISAFEAEVASSGRQCSRILANKAFHSCLISKAAEQLMGLGLPSVQDVAIPVVANHGGDWLNADMLKDGRYWADQIQCTVMWEHNVQSLFEKDVDVVLELGPASALSAATIACVPQECNDVTFVQVMKHPGNTFTSDMSVLRDALTRLAMADVDVHNDSWWSSAESRASKPVPIERASKVSDADCMSEAPTDVSDNDDDDIGLSTGSALSVSGDFERLCSPGLV
jgi:acyl transferase domain-containing protein